MSAERSDIAMYEAPIATTKENCHLFLSYLSPEERQGIYDGITAQGKVYRAELIASLGEDGYAYAMLDFPGARFCSVNTHKNGEDANMSAISDGFHAWCKERGMHHFPAQASAAYEAGYLAGFEMARMEQKMPPTAGTEERQNTITQDQYSAKEA